MEQFSDLAPNILMVTPAPAVMGGGGTSNPVELNAQTVKNLEHIAGVKEVVPTIQRMVTLRAGESTMTVMVMGSDQSKEKYISPTLEYAEGTYVQPHDSVGAVVGYEVKHPPGRTKPLVSVGQTITLEYTAIQTEGDEQKQVTQERRFIVRGVTEDVGSGGMGMNLNRVVSISLPAANAFFKSSNKYDTIMVVTEDFNINDQVEDAIRERYGEDVGVTSFTALTETIQGFISAFSVLFLSIAAVSLVVAAVGVITTLYTSVLERTREVGVLKALGFRKSSIMTLFLSEAAIIGMIGGAVGLLLGAVAGSLLLSNPFGSAAMSITPVYLPTDLVFVWLFSVAISALAGLYPAWRAARLDPVASLRS